MNAVPEDPAGDDRLEGLLAAMRACHRGDPSARAPVTPGEQGTVAELCRLFNAIAERTRVLETELDLLARRSGDSTQSADDSASPTAAARSSAEGAGPPALLVYEAEYESGYELEPESGPESDLESEPGDERQDAAEAAPGSRGPMHAAARTALRGLGGGVDSARVVGIGSPESVRAASASHRAVGALVDARAPLDRLLTIVAAFDSALPGMPLLCFAPEGDAAALDRARTAARGRNRAQIVRSVGHAVERLTLHWLTDAPGTAERLAEPEDPAYGRVRFDGEKVLVVDDDVRNVFATVSALELYGLTALTADSGPAAIEILERNPDVGVVLMDLMMPGLDGYATTARIRSQAENSDVPVVAVTARAAPGDRERSLAAGMDEHVTKPVEVDRLLTLIRRLIKR